MRGARASAARSRGRPPRCRSSSPADRRTIRQVVEVVELQVLVHVEPVAERAGEHPAPGRRADDRELLEREVDRRIPSPRTTSTRKSSITG